MRTGLLALVLVLLRRRARRSPGARHPARRRQRPRLPARRRAPLPRDPRPRHVRRHDRVVEHARARAAVARLLRLGARLREPRDRPDRRLGRASSSTSSSPVLATTGAAKVSLVGHSQGGMLARYVAVRRGRLDVVDDIVGLAPSSHGTTTPLAGPAGGFGCPACAEQAAGSAVHAQGQRAAARGARARLVHGRHHHPRRGRHAVPVAGAGGRPRDQRDPPGQVPERPVRARHDRRRPGRDPVDGQRARAPGRGQPALRARLQRRELRPRPRRPRRGASQGAPPAAGPPLRVTLGRTRPRSSAAAPGSASAATAPAARSASAGSSCAAPAPAAATAPRLPPPQRQHAHRARPPQPQRRAAASRAATASTSAPARCSPAPAAASRSRRTVTGCAERSRPRGSGHVRLRDRRRRLSRLRPRQPPVRGPGRVRLPRRGRPSGHRGGPPHPGGVLPALQDALRLGLRDRARARARRPQRLPAARPRARRLLARSTR